jgi:hypothetical protein
MHNIAGFNPGYGSAVEHNPVRIQTEGKLKLLRVIKGR